MRLWHIDILPYLPNSQLIAQKRECDLIWKDYCNGKHTNHILINYIYEYNIKDLASYYEALRKEFEKRGFKFAPKWGGGTLSAGKPFARHQNKEYLTICYWNLREKYLRGQKDFSTEQWKRLQNFYYMY